MLPGAAGAVGEVGALLRAWRADTRATSGRWEGAQFKARADAMAHEALAARLRRVAPGVPVLSEEDPAGLRGPRPNLYWLIDPIDGTASYAHGYPGYVTQAALVAAARPVLAAVCAPEWKVRFTALRGRGAFAEGGAAGARARLAAAPHPGPGAGVLTDNTPRPTGIARAAYNRFGCSGYLESGSLALKLCRIAEGRAHLFVKDVPVRDWDVAAPGLVLEEAGGALRRLDGTLFNFTGSFEHTGLIGAADPGLCAAVAEWHRPG
ncbi:inositol monophosphatase family protein [Streptomonospora nanhaiensis]|uniref:inositol monophosphatase family protein n=1 Tax=Streptomonospora nanhaiensis TaxID=1323731 RepID=UPI0015CB1BB3|nr:inositol monophosphatase family protein [Streptomonospora nanhaiensis]MBV2363636.1 inositol monophosphatase [Streptomonospora nanhaiensis]MBX9391092.1 inositol monophosphatase [Streptomonospora nanhaiensis]